MASTTISLRPMTTPSSSRVITLTSSRPSLPISSNSEILGVKPLKGVDGREKRTSLLPEITYIAHLFIITSYCALFLLRIICYLLFLFFRTQLLDTPTVFFFCSHWKKKRMLTTDDNKEKIGRWPGFVGRSIGFWGGDEYRVYNIPWCNFGIMCPGIDQSCFNVGSTDDDYGWWHRRVGIDNDLFNGHYRENPNCHSLPASHKPRGTPIKIVTNTLIIVSIVFTSFNGGVCTKRELPIQIWQQSLSIRQPFASPPLSIVLQNSISRNRQRALSCFVQLIFLLLKLFNELR